MSPAPLATPPSRLARVRLALLAALTALAACPEWRPVERLGGSSDCSPGATGPRAYDALAYDVSARFDWSTLRLAAREEITLSLCPGAPTTVELDSAVQVTGVHAGGRPLPHSADPGTETIAVNLAPLAPGDGPVTFTVEYEAEASRALVATTSVDLDPVRSRVLFTDSEPRGGHLWMVEKDDPSDRALFSVELEVGPDEDAVANGERVSEAPIAGGGRRIRHALDAPIPTYLMAFAAGELEHVERTHQRPAPAGAVPLALWHRRGLAIDPAGNLDAVEDALEAFEALLGPYPFARYAVVLLPRPFRGGMENATITFDWEDSGQGSIAFGLNAHELAHQWFGDWVTMRTYDDVWVKEGMATLLAAEAERARRDLEGRGRLMAADFSYDPDDAIVDPALTGAGKYTSGPYGRAAALLTQIRALVGEAAFWSSCRAFLEAHELGSATGEDFLRAFAPGLVEPTLERALATLPHKERPDLTLTAAGDDITLAVADPGADLLAPLRVTVVDGAGQAAVHTLAPGVPTTLTVPADGYLAPDEAESHADLDVLFDVFDEFGPAVSYDIVPSIPPEAASPAGAAFLGRSAAHQERAVGFAGLPGLAAADLAGFVGSLDSPYARQYALETACYLAASDPDLVAPLVTLLDHPPLERFSPYLVDCPQEVADAFEARFLALAVAAGGGDLGRLEYLLSFGYGSAGLAEIVRLASEGPSLEIREWAAYRTSLFGGAPAGGAARDRSAAPLAGGRPRPHLEEGKGDRSDAR